MTPTVVRAMLNDRPVVAVNCSPLASRPWTAVDVSKGWTIACRDEDLDKKEELWPRPGLGDVFNEMFASAGEEDTNTGVGPEAGVFTVTMPPGATAEQVQARMNAVADQLLGSIVCTPPPAPTFVEDQWRVIGPDNDPYTGEAPEAWGYLVDTLDRYGYIDRVEQHVDGTWRVRSMRDLLQAAGGDPL